MAKKKWIFGFDTGASETRYFFITPDKKPSKIKKLPNAMAFLDSVNEKVTATPSTNAITDSLDLLITRAGEAESQFRYPLRVILGDLATKVSPTLTRPITIRHKYEQKTTYTSIAAVISMELMAHDSLDDNEITVFLALPPLEVSDKKETVVAELNGDYSVTYGIYKQTVNFSVTVGGMYAESFLATLPFLYDVNLAPRSSSADFRDGYLLTLDIGASTTDVIVLKDGKFLDYSYDTIKHGGNTARDFMIEEIRRAYDIKLSPDEAESVMSTGVLKMGKDKRKVGDEISTAKRRCAQLLWEDLTSYFDTKKIPVKMLRGILTVGGGALPSGYMTRDAAHPEEAPKFVEVAPPMSKMLMELVSSVSNSMSIESLDHPRIGNIMGMMMVICNKESIACPV